jgi:hypothetical protein
MAGVMKSKEFLLFALFLLIQFALFSFASEDGNNYSVRVPEFNGPPKIDGHLENTLWKKGPALDTFTQHEPQEGAQPSEETIAYV